MRWNLRESCSDRCGARLRGGAGADVRALTLGADEHQRLSRGVGGVGKRVRGAGIELGDLPGCQLEIR